MNEDPDMNPLATPLTLPCGVVLPNRLGKAAMSEGLADFGNRSDARLETLYGRWSESGAGLLISGNLMVDGQHLERPLNLVVDADDDLAALRRLAVRGTTGDTQFWAQLSHAGRQVAAAINPAPLAPSAIEVDVTSGSGYEFARPVAMTNAQIAIAIDQFAMAAAKVRAAGFTGVQLHAAHGYLISQFLSPLSNTRTDEWGGSLANRSRFLIRTVAAVRHAVGPQFPLAVKLNASDFQRGGFTRAECIRVVEALNATSVDLLELSGGSLEQPKILGITVKPEGEDGTDHMAGREAYFLDFAADVRAAAAMPVMITGGFRTAAVMADAVARGEVDLIGLGRPMIAEPDTPRRLLAGAIDRTAEPEIGVRPAHLMAWCNVQLMRLADGLEPDPELTGPQAAVRFTALESANVAALLDHRAVRRAESA